MYYFKLFLFKESKVNKTDSPKDSGKSWDQLSGSISSCNLPSVSMEPTGCSVEEVLQVLRLVYVLSKENSQG